MTPLEEAIVGYLAARNRVIPDSNTMKVHAKRVLKWIEAYTFGYQLLHWLFILLMAGCVAVLLGMPLFQTALAVMFMRAIILGIPQVERMGASEAQNKVNSLLEEIAASCPERSIQLVSTTGDKNGLRN
jgi:hypothetical protein